MLDNFAESDLEIASEISLEIKKINKVLSAETEKGYCNVTIDWNDIVINVIKEINSKSYAKTVEKADRILIEHTSANPTGPFHMGRARNPIIGDSIARLLPIMDKNEYDKPECTVTAQYEVKFKRPTPFGPKLKLKSRILGVQEDRAEIVIELRADGKTCVHLNPTTP